MKNLKFQILQLTTPHSVHHSWVDELFNDTLYWNKRGEIKKKGVFVWGLLKRSRTDLEEWNRGVWGGDRNGVEAWRFCHEGWEGNKCLGDGKDLLLLLQLSTMLLLLLRLNCSSHSLARSLHSTSSLLIFFGQRWCHCTCRLVCRLLYSVY